MPASMTFAMLKAFALGLAAWAMPKMPDITRMAGSTVIPCAIVWKTYPRKRTSSPAAATAKNTNE